MRHTSSLAFRSLSARPLRTVLTAMGIVLGVAVILAIDIANASTLQSVTQVFAEASGKASLTIVASSEDDAGFSSAVLRQVEDVPGVQAAVPSVHAQAVLATEGTPAQLDMNMLGAAAAGLLLYGVDPAQDGQVRDYKLLEGRFLVPRSRAYEVLLVRDYAQPKKIHLDSEIEIVTAGNRVRLRVVGLIAKEGPGVLNNGAFGVLPLRAAQEILGRGGKVDQIDVVAAPEWTGAARLDELKSGLQSRLGSKYDVAYPAMQGQRVAQMLSGYQMGLSVFSAIAIFVGVFLIYNAFSMTVVERTREIGTLRILGMTRRQVLQEILVEAGLLGIAGSLGGMGAGALLALGLIRGMALLLGQEVRTVSVPATGLAASFLIGVAATLVAALIPAFQGSRVSPLEALRARSQSRPGRLARLGWVAGLLLFGLSVPLLAVRLPSPAGDWTTSAAAMLLLLSSLLLVPIVVTGWEWTLRPAIRRLYGSEGALGRRNIRRSRLRTTLTVAALMVGVAMILSIRAVTDSFGRDLNGWIQRYIGGDLYVHSSSKMPPEVGRGLQEVEGVDGIAPLRYLDVKRIKPDGGRESLGMMGVDPLAYSRVTAFVFASNEDQAGQMIARLNEGNALFVSSVLAEKHGLRRGDQVRLATRRGERDFEVAGVVVDFYNQGRVVQLSWRDLRRYFDVDDASAYLVKVAPGYGVADVRERIDASMGDTYHLTVDSNAALRGRAMSLLGQTTGMFDVLALIAMIVAALGVVNTLTMNVVERTGELGMLRSLGMTRRQVEKMILAEAAMVGLAGGLLGLLLGLVLSRSVIGSMNTMGGFSLEYVFSAPPLLAVVVIAFVVSQIAALWPARRAAGIRIIEAIQFE